MKKLKPFYSCLSLKSSFPGNANKNEIITIEVVVADTDDMQESTAISPRLVAVISKIKYNTSAHNLLIFLSSYNAFGNAPATRFRGYDMMVAIVKNNTILPTDSY